ncbi:hypothetical protein [Pelomonas cellulosilytica]|uniref:IPTL-CTERM protein sorting domain-containing protein n=1 Tax=Pelomonas cellulosilytica TaxID=2906762 RepID=A0ABS8Y2U7_9BURK|nr:hypothetical protein [Pelomonas sp. P8]MCE4557368.1 hypothetical protein [Pelomonas sp. P8]
MKLVRKTFGIALFGLAIIASAQTNSTFANRAPIFHAGGNGPVTITTRLNTNQQVENVVDCSAPRVQPTPLMTYGYNAWYSYSAGEVGYLEVAPQNFYDAKLYFGSSLASLVGPLDKLAYGSGTVHYIKLAPRQELIYRNCLAASSVPASIPDQAATIRFLPGLEADLSTFTVVDKATYGFSGYVVNARVNNLSAVRPSGSFVLAVTLEADSGFSIKPSQLGNGGTDITGSDTYEGTGSVPTLSQLTQGADGRYRMTITFPKAVFSIPPLGIASDGYYGVSIPVVTAASAMKATASISTLENPDPNSLNNSFTSEYVPPPPSGSSGPVGTAGANVPTASEWQLLIFGVLLFAGALYVARRSGRQG